MSCAEQPFYDVVIVGAAISGLTLACCLIHQGLRIAIIDQRSSGLVPTDVSYAAGKSNQRVSAINLGSQQILERYEIWSRLSPLAISEFQGLEVWEGGSSLRFSLSALDMGWPYLGSIINNNQLQTAMLLQVQTSRDCEWFFSETILDWQRRDDTLVLCLASGLSITTQLVVGADGIDSSVRQLAGIKIKMFDYQQQGLVTTVETTLPHKKIARQIFLPSGPLAFLPLSDPRHCSIVWSTSPEEAARLVNSTDELFKQELAAIFEHCLGNIQDSSLTRLCFSLKTQHSEHYIKSGVALIGDAAHTVHPLAGQGANLGIADAHALAKVILAAKHSQQALGLLESLRPFERERRFHHRLMGESIDLIKQLFSSGNPVIKRLRHAGLGAINQLTCVKNKLAYYAMGSPMLYP